MGSAEQDGPDFVALPRDDRRAITGPSPSVPLGASVHRVHALPDDPRHLAVLDHRVGVACSCRAFALHDPSTEALEATQLGFASRISPTRLSFESRPFSSTLRA